MDIFIFHDKWANGMNVALFLGAGASVPYGKPTIKQLNDILSKESDDIKDFLSYYPSIEHALTAINDINKFNETEGAKWRNREVDAQKYRSLEIMDADLHRAIYRICSWRRDCNKIAADIFSPIFGFVREQGSEITVFTTNYDRSVEEYCAQPQHKSRCVDGFSPRSGRYAWSGDYTGSNGSGGERNVFLYKLHGSLDWKFDGKNRLVKINIEDSCTVLPNVGQDFIIYPTLEKNSAESGKVFAEIFGKFSARLKMQDVCVVVGFSFQDEQIKKRFIEFLNAGKKLIVIDPSKNTGLQKTIKALPKDKRERVTQNVHHVKKELSASAVNSTINHIRYLEVIRKMDNSSRF